MRAIASQVPSCDFEVGAEPIIRSLRSALSALITGIPNFTYNRPNDLALELGLDPKLAWNVGRSVEAADPFASARFIPGPAGIRTLLRAAKRRGVPSEILDGARISFDAFCELVHKHAGSRKHFNMLAAGMARKDCARSDIEHRRMLFDGNTYLWGVQAGTIFRTCIVIPSQDADTWDVATIRGFIDFSRMRPNVTWRISQPMSVDGHHNIRLDVSTRALDPSADGPLPLLTQYCTKPVPRFRSVIGALGVPEFEFIESSVGNTARINFITAELLRCVEPRRRTTSYADFCVSFSVRTPAKMLVFDLLRHRDSFQGSSPPIAELYGDLFGGGPALRYNEANRLPLHESISFVGAGTDTPFTPDIPKYSEMLRFALQQIGYDSAAFDLYRFHMRYPPLPTTLMLRTPLPETG